MFKKYLVSILVLLCVLVPVVSSASTLSDLTTSLSGLVDKLSQVVASIRNTSQLALTPITVVEGNPPVSGMPGVRAIVDPCAGKASSCYQSFFKFACSRPAAIYDLDLKNTFPAFTPFIVGRDDVSVGGISRNRITEPCADFCTRFSSLSGFSDVTSCRNAALDFAVQNPVMKMTLTGVDLANPLNSNPDKLVFSTTNTASYCDSLMDGMGQSRTSNWNNSCRSNISNFLNSSLSVPTWLNLKLVSFKRYLYSRVTVTGTPGLDFSVKDVTPLEDVTGFTYVNICNNGNKALSDLAIGAGLNLYLSAIGDQVEQTGFYDKSSVIGGLKNGNCSKIFYMMKKGKMDVSGAGNVLSATILPVGFVDTNPIDNNASYTPGFYIKNVTRSVSGGNNNFKATVCNNSPNSLVEQKADNFYNTDMSFLGFNLVVTSDVETDVFKIATKSGDQFSSEQGNLSIPGGVSAFENLKNNNCLDFSYTPKSNLTIDQTYTKTKQIGFMLAPNDRTIDTPTIMDNIFVYNENGDKGFAPNYIEFSKLTPNTKRQFANALGAMVSSPVTDILGSHTVVNNDDIISIFSVARDVAVLAKSNSSSRFLAAAGSSGDNPPDKDPLNQIASECLNKVATELAIPIIDVSLDDAINFLTKKMNVVTAFGWSHTIATDPAFANIKTPDFVKVAGIHPKPIVDFGRDENGKIFCKLSSPGGQICNYDIFTYYSDQVAHPHNNPFSSDDCWADAGCVKDYGQTAELTARAQATFSNSPTSGQDKRVMNIFAKGVSLDMGPATSVPISNAPVDGAPPGYTISGKSSCRHVMKKGGGGGTAELKTDVQNGFTQWGKYTFESGDSVDTRWNIGFSAAVRFSLPRI